MSAVPGKRVTRSRAAATKTADEMDVPPKRSGTVKVATSRRAKAMEEDLPDTQPMLEATRTRRPPKSAAPPPPALPPTRRRIKVTPLDAPILEKMQIVGTPAEQPATKKTKSSSKVKKKGGTDWDEHEGKEKHNEAEALPSSKAKARSVVPKNKSEEMQPSTKTRGRPKKPVASDLPEQPQIQESVRQTRSRASSGAAVAQATAVPTAKIAAPARKKVTFQDLPEGDKENQPINVKKPAAKAQTAPTAARLRAKPVRRPATGRSTKAADTENLELAKPKPLSPKKVTQVAKSTSPNSSDDELSGAKTPVRDLSQSPRRNTDLAVILSPVKKIDFGTALAYGSPGQAAAASNLMSPARRPPSTPFKDALKGSPKRGEGALIFPPSAQASFASVPATSVSQHQSTLLQSPKRGAQDTSIFAQSTTKTLKSPTKVTLLHSPAKRLLSPTKPRTAAGTPGMTGRTQTFENEVHDTVVSSHFRASQSPERSVKVHRLSDEELASEARANVDFDESVLDFRSPLKLSRSPHKPLEKTDELAEPLSIIADDHMSVVIEPQEHNHIGSEDNDTDPDEAGDFMEGILPSSAVEFVTPDIASKAQEVSLPKATFLFRSAHPGHDEDESSEDELQADTTSTQFGQMNTPGLATKNVKSRLSTVNPADMSTNLGFTPLAAQFSSWLASSPDKAQKTKAQPRGFFSPLAAQHVPGKVQMSRQSTPQRVFTGSRLRRSEAGTARKAAAAPTRSFSDSIMAGTPENPSYFADEMIMKDLEEDTGALLADEQEDHPLLVDFVEDLAHATTAEGAGEEAPSETIAVEMVEAAPADVPQKASNEIPAVGLVDLIQDGVPEEALYNVSAVEIVAANAPGGVIEEVQVVEDDCSSTIPEDFEVCTDDVTTEIVGTAEMTESSTNNQENPILREQAILPDKLSPHEEAEISSGSAKPSFENDSQATYMVDACSGNTPQPADQVVTPVRQHTQLSRFANTMVSKVPLRPEGYISPIKVPRKRSRSLSVGPASTKKHIIAPNYFPRSNTVISLSPQLRAKSPVPETPDTRSFLIDDFGDSTLDGIEVDEDDENFPPPTPFATIRSTVATPTRSPLKAVESNFLQGVVVFVDVHTTEGADASGIFVELLTQMGARCVKQWNWNPRASIAGGGEKVETMPAGLAGKVGITHVVYKDGGKRTLEKVRNAGGVVRCVGVGWVLDCERENKWLDESHYAVDTSILPRGGSRRRKSMEPRALINLNGSLSAAKGRRSDSAEMITAAVRGELVASPVRVGSCPLGIAADKTTDDEEEVEDEVFGSLNSSFSTPTGVHAAAAFSASTTSNRADAIPATPTGYVNYDPDEENSQMSPTTPYYLSQGAKLMQQTCPPKQTQKGLFDMEKTGSGKGFPVSGRIDDQPDEGVRKRLEQARRKTMNWKPRVGSPLTRGV